MRFSTNFSMVLCANVYGTYILTRNNIEFKIIQDNLAPNPDFMVIVVVVDLKEEYISKTQKYSEKLHEP